MTDASKVGRLLLAGVGLALVGCIKGPFWRPESLTLPALLPHEPIKGVVVSDFRASLFVAERAGRGERVYRDGPATDISAEIASGLREAKIDARAVANGRPEALKEGEVLLHGSLRGVRPVEPGAEAFQGCILCCTFGIYGCVLPMAIPVPMGIVFNVHVEVLDNKGALLMQATRVVDGSYSCNSFWAAAEVKRRAAALVDDVKAKAVRALAERLRE